MNIASKLALSLTLLGGDVEEPQVNLEDLQGTHCAPLINGFKANVVDLLLEITDPSNSPCRIESDEPGNCVTTTDNVQLNYTCNEIPATNSYHCSLTFDNDDVEYDILVNFDAATDTSPDYYSVLLMHGLNDVQRLYFEPGTYCSYYHYTDTGQTTCNGGPSPCNGFVQGLYQRMSTLPLGR